MEEITRTPQTKDCTLSTQYTVDIRLMLKCSLAVLFGRSRMWLCGG